MRATPTRRPRRRGEAITVRSGGAGNSDEARHYERAQAMRKDEVELRPQGIGEGCGGCDELTDESELDGGGREGESKKTAAGLGLKRRGRLRRGCHLLLEHGHASFCM